MTDPNYRSERRFLIEENHPSEISVALRWLAIAPSCLATVAASPWIIRVVSDLIYSYFSGNTATIEKRSEFVTASPPPLPNAVIQLIFAAIVPGLFVLVGTSIAPEKKWDTGLFLTAAWLPIMAFLAFRGYSTNYFTINYSEFTAIALVFSAASIAISLLKAYHDEKNAPFELYDLP